MYLKKAWDKCEATIQEGIVTDRKVNQVFETIVFEIDILFI